MRYAGRVVLIVLATLSLAAAIQALPPRITHGSALPDLLSGQDPAQAQSVSGKIASVEKSSFTLTVGHSQTSTPGQQIQQDPASPKTMAFQLDKNTTIEGSLKVGASADVTYRQDSGTNVAISVRVTQ